jgi:hypothetical protein
VIYVVIGFEQTHYVKSLGYMKHLSLDDRRFT